MQSLVSFRRWWRVKGRYEIRLHGLALAIGTLAFGQLVFRSNQAGAVGQVALFFGLLYWSLNGPESPELLCYECGHHFKGYSTQFCFQCSDERMSELRHEFRHT